MGSLDLNSRGRINMLLKKHSFSDGQTKQTKQTQIHNPKTCDKCTLNTAHSTRRAYCARNMVFQIVKYENLKDKENSETPVELIRSRPEYSCRATAKDYLSQQDRQSEQQQQPCVEHRTDFSHGNELLRKPTSRILQAI